jgi:hypothetical protein
MNTLCHPERSEGSVAYRVILHFVPLLSGEMA